MPDLRELLSHRFEEVGLIEGRDFGGEKCVRLFGYVLGSELHGLYVWIRAADCS